MNKRWGRKPGRTIKLEIRTTIWKEEEPASRSQGPGMLE